MPSSTHQPHAIIIAAVWKDPAALKQELEAALKMQEAREITGQGGEDLAEGPQ